MKKMIMILMTLNSMAQAGLTVHEWGTFTSLMGADGKRQNGMYHEDEFLPNFVHKFGENYRLELNQKTNVGSVEHFRPCPPNSKACYDLFDKMVTQKMETPVIYFYSDKDAVLNIDVGFPKGIIAESYPAMTTSFPKEEFGADLLNGFGHYHAEIFSNKVFNIPDVEKGNIYSHARNVKSNYVRVGSEYEKFIFYRGVGDFETDLNVKLVNNKLILKNNGNEIKNIFIINSNEQNGSMFEMSNVGKDSVKEISSTTLNNILNPKMPKSNFIKLTKELMVKRLTENGLYQDEAEAMLNTWEQSYLKNNGLRVLYILNRDEVERILPMNIYPRPTSLNRVFIGRIDVLSDKQENEILQKILADKEKFDANALGRMAHPILNRVLQLAKERKLSKDIVHIIEQQINSLR